MESQTASALAVLSGTDRKALELLATGVPAAQCAAAIGVSPSRIAQLISDPVFSELVAERKYESLAAHNERDSKYDKLEDMALGQLEASLPMVMDPMKLARIAQTLNAAKRRGASAPESITSRQTIVNLVLPLGILQKFAVQTNANNQVTTIDEQSMVTIQSGQVQGIAEQVREAKNEREIIDKRQLQIATKNLNSFGFEG